MTFFSCEDMAEYCRLVEGREPLPSEIWDAAIDSFRERLQERAEIGKKGITKLMAAGIIGKGQAYGDGLLDGIGSTMDEAMKLQEGDVRRIEEK